MSRENVSLGLASMVASVWTFITGLLPSITSNQFFDFVIKIASASVMIAVGTATYAHYRASRRREDAQAALAVEQMSRERADRALAEERLRRLRLGLDEDEVSP